MNKKKVAPIVALVAIAVTALGLAAAVYAKYVSSITKTGTATVAKWAFTTDNQSGTVACTLDETYDTDTLVSGKIAPGTSGKCPISISNATSEVGIRYDIKPSTVANQPQNLKFYKDVGHQQELVVGGSETVWGTLAPGGVATGVYVYWEWPYEDDPSSSVYDSKDTADGERAATMTMTFDVVGTQVEPSAL